MMYVSKNLITTDGIEFLSNEYATAIRFKHIRFQIVFGQKQLGTGWSQEVYIPYTFSEEPRIVATANNENIARITNSYTNRFYVYTSGDCWINWIAVGKY